MRRTLACLMVFIPLLSSAQFVISGKVINDKTKTPLAFASIVLKNQNQGTTTDIDGKFKIQIQSPGVALIITHIGYETRVIVVNNQSEIIIRLKERATQLNEVVVRPDDNPAFRIIRAATKNKPLNDPENLPTFSYNAYNKLYSTLLDQDSADLPDNVDTAKFRRYLRDNHLFIQESYTERKFKKPAFSHEVVLGNHLSGVKDPFFAFLATDLQPFSFYKDYILLFNKTYLSPLSPGSTSRYDFVLMDTLYQNRDSVFVISFEPLPGKVFEGLKGQLHITTDGFAIESVEAQPADDKALVEILIQQKYEKPDSVHWFPVQLNAELRFKQFAIQNLKLKYITRSYFTNITIGEDFQNNTFGIANVEFDPLANRRDDAFWQPRRMGEFEIKESNTFHVLDSVGEKMVAFQAAFKVVEGLFVGRFKAGKFYLPVEHLLQLNQYEKVRAGIGLQTGEQLSRWLMLEGNVGYGFGDRALKYGAAIQFNIERRKETYVKLSYKQDLAEPGRPSFIRSAIAARTQESLRNWMTSRMDSVEQVRVEFTQRPFHASQVTFFGQQQKRNPAYDYSFVDDDNVTRKRFTIFEAGIQWRFAPNETYTRIGQSQVVSQFTYPQINFSLSQTFTGFMEGEYAFTKLEVRADHQFMIRGLGKTTFQFATGVMDGMIPYPFLFYGKGSKFDDSFLNNLMVNNYFQTMGLYEFMSDRYGYLFVNHYVGRITGNKSRHFRPELFLIHNMGIGTLKNRTPHQGVPFQTMEHGYFESGIMLTNLIRFNYLNLGYFGIGAGGCYRYGHYTFANRTDNVVAKLVLTLSL